MIEFKHTRALLKKNFRIWKRTPCLSFFEILSPLLICAVLVFLRQSIEKDILEVHDFGEITIEDDGNVGYTTVYHYPLIDIPNENVRVEEEFMEREYAFAGVIPRSRLFFLPKPCFWTGNFHTQKRMVGLSPENDFTRAIEKQIMHWRYLWREDYGYYLSLEV